MNLAVPVPARIAVAVHPTGPEADAVKRRILGLALPEARLFDAGRGDPTRGRVDYVLHVNEPSVYRDDLVSAGLEALRNDLSTAAVGLSATGAPSGEVEFAVSRALVLVRADALRGVGGWDSSDGVLDDLDLCARLWLAGHRVRSLGPGHPLVGEDAPEPARHDAVMRALATILEEVDVDRPEWADGDSSRHLTAARGRRAAAQRSRRRGSGEMVPLMHQWVTRWAPTGAAGAQAAEIVRRWGAPTRAGTGRRVLVVTTDVVAPMMAGPGIRATELARALAEDHEVVLASTARCELSPSSYRATFATEADLARLVGEADVIVIQGWAMAARPYIAGSDKVVVADLYDPIHLEQLEQGLDARGERGRYDAVRGAAATLNEQMRRADFMICASPKQRDLWLGSLAALGRINSITYRDDPSLESLLSIVPFGVPDEPIGETAGRLRGVVPGIGEADKVILWGGGVYNWFDPLTLVRAVDQLRQRVPNVRLFFMGLAHPNPEVPEMQMVRALRRLVDELGLEGTHVFYNDGWVEYDQRAGYLVDADIGVSTHFHHVETEFSFRTRILDYLWAGLPVVATAGDGFADLIEREAAGRVVPAEDVDALTDALESLLTDPEAHAAARAASRSLGGRLGWAANVAPLVRFCRHARRSPDIAAPNVLVSPDGAELQRGIARDLRVAYEYARAGGLRLLADRALTRLRRVSGRGG